jgi:hypothetical protein
MMTYHELNAEVHAAGKSWLVDRCSRPSPQQEAKSDKPSSEEQHGDKGHGETLSRDATFRAYWQFHSHYR